MMKTHFLSFLGGWGQQAMGLYRWLTAAQLRRKKHLLEMNSPEFPPSALYASQYTWEQGRTVHIREHEKD